MSRPSIEIVSHCYAGEMPQYAAMLHYQISSLILNPPNNCSVMLTIANNPSDEYVGRLYREVSRYMDSSCGACDWLEINWRGSPRCELFRRAIVRNIRALNTVADAIWMTDVDHCFGPGCIDALADLIATGELDEFSRIKHLQVNRTHACGDMALAHAQAISAWSTDNGPYQPFRPLSVEPNDFQPRCERRPIGGLQIMRRDLANRIGYLNGTKWVNPVDPTNGFRQCKCDVAFRKTTPKAKAIELPNLFRIRHSRAGRDGGKKDHSQ